MMRKMAAISRISKKESVVTASVYQSLRVLNGEARHSGKLFNITTGDK